MTKVPPSRLVDLFPPDITGYSYFDGLSARPFNHGAVDFDLGNASLLADASLLAYSDPSAIIDKLTGFTLGRLFSTGVGTDGFAAYNDSACVVVFRGTQVLNRTDVDDLTRGQNVRLEALRIFDALQDDFTDGLGLPGRFHGYGVHLGFRRAYESVRKELFDYLERLGGPPRTLWFAGHSLGGAVATLAAFEVHANGHDVQGLYTFGCPHVGSSRFAAAFPFPVFRVVYHNDIVARLPIGLLPDGVFDAPGEIVFVDTDGSIFGTDGLPSLVTQELSALVNLILRPSVRDLIFSPRVPVDWVADHAPLLYAIHLANAAQDS